MTTEHYEDNMRHVAEPAAPKARDDAQSATVEDYVALWFATQLREYAHYEAEGSYSDIALGYAEYIEKKIYVEEAKNVSLYAHTKDAIETLESAWAYGFKNDNSETASIELGDALDKMYEQE